MASPHRRSREETDRARKLRREVSVTERKLWRYLRGAGVGASFRKQHPMAGFHLDYYCASLKFAVEIDGPHHDPASDSERDAVLARHGVEVLRFSAGD